MRFGFIMNAIMTPVVLGIVFYTTIVPVGLIFRLRGRDLLHREWDDELVSYRVVSGRSHATHMEKPF